MRKRLTGVLLLGLAASLPLSGQEIWTLEDCVNYAMEHNIDLQKQAHNIDRETLTVQEGKWAFVPRLSVSTSYTMSTGRVLDPTTYEFVKTKYTGNSSTSVSGDVTLFEGGRKLYALSRAELSLRAAILQEESLKYNLHIQIAGAYMDALCAREQEQIARETAELVERQLKRTLTLYEAGSVIETDVLQFRTQLSAAQKDVTSALHAGRMALLVLCDLLERDDYEDFQIAEPTDLELSLGVWDREAILESHPDIRSAALKKELANVDYKLARAALSPRLSLSAGFGTSYSDARQKALFNEDGTIRYEAYPFFQQYADNGSAFVSLSLSIPILNGLSTRNGIKRTKLAVADTELSARQTRKSIRKQLIQAEMDYYSARDCYCHSEKEVEYAREVFIQVDHKYNLGAVDFLTWHTATVELAKSRYALAEARYTCLLRLEILKNLGY